MEYSLKFLILGGFEPNIMYKNKSKKLITLSLSILLLSFVAPTVAYSQASFKAVCKQKEVAVGQRFEVSFRVENAQYRKFSPPSLTGFDILGTTKGSRTVFANGRSSVVNSITYTLSPKRQGTFRIGKAEIITSKGKVLRSKPIKIKVLSASQAPKDNLSRELAGKVFLRTEISNPTPVVGEQVTIDIKVYTQIDIEQLEIVKEPSFESLFSHYVRSYNGPKGQERINGKEYTTKVLRRIVVFPSKSGTVVVEPAMVDIGVPVNGGNSLFNPFYQLATYSIKSTPVELEVQALDGAPAGFSGMVGNFQMQAHVPETNIQSDEVIQLKIRMVGEGDIKQLLPPDLGVNKKYFDQFEPNSKEDIREGGGLLGGIKTFDYVLTPKAIGEFSIQPKFVYFDAKKKKFVTLDTLIPIKITKGKIDLPTTAELDKMQANAYNGEQKEEAELLTYGEPQKEAVFQQKRQPFLGTLPFWLLALVPFLAMGGAFYYKKQLEQQAAIPVSERKKQNAASEASKRLQAANEQMNTGDAKAFYNEISKALLGFVSDKYNIPTVQLTKDNVKQRLSQQEIAKEKIDNLLAILQTCEMALFAGLSNTDAMQKVYSDSEELIKLMEG